EAVQVRAADAGGDHPDEDLARTRVRVRQVDDVHAADVGHAQGLHRAPARVAPRHGASGYVTRFSFEPVVHMCEPWFLVVKSREYGRRRRDGSSHARPWPIHGESDPGTPMAARILPAASRSTGYSECGHRSAVREVGMVMLSAAQTPVSASVVTG